MRSGLIILLVLCQLMVLSLPSSAESEMLTAGKYDVSFTLNATDDYSIDWAEENATYQIFINDSIHDAVIYIEEADSIGFEDAAAIVDDLFEQAGVDQPEHYSRQIDGNRAVLGVGSLSGDHDSEQLFTAAYPRYFGAEATGIYVLIGSNYPWEATRSLLDSLKVDINRSAGGEAQEMPPLAGPEDSARVQPGQSDGPAPGPQSADYGMPLPPRGNIEGDSENGLAGDDAGETAGQSGEQSVEGETSEQSSEQSADEQSPNQELIYDGYITISGGSGQSQEDALAIRNAPNEKDGVAAERYYLQETYGQKDSDWFFVGQELVTGEDRHFDRIDIQLADGTGVSVYFDISEFYGVK